MLCVCLCFPPLAHLHIRAVCIMLQLEDLECVVEDEKLRARTLHKVQGGTYSQHLCLYDYIYCFAVGPFLTFSYVYTLLYLCTGGHYPSSLSHTYIRDFIFAQEDIIRDLSTRQSSSGTPKAGSSTPKVS